MLKKSFLERSILLPRGYLTPTFAVLAIVDIYLIVGPCIAMFLYLTTTDPTLAHEVQPYQWQTTVA